MDDGKDAESDEDSLETLLASLNLDECNYRIYLREELMAVANRQATAYIMQLFPGPMSCNAISISGIHANVPPADILAFAEVSKQARGLPIDLERLAADLAAGTAKTHQTGNMCTYQWPLTHSCNFEHSASPFGV